MPEPQALPLEIGGGIWDTGDGAKAPDGTGRVQQNLLKKSFALIKRPAFVYEDDIEAESAIFGIRKRSSKQYLVAAGSSHNGVSYDYSLFELETTATAGWVRRGRVDIPVGTFPQSVTLSSRALSVPTLVSWQEKVLYCNRFAEGILSWDGTTAVTGFSDLNLGGVEFGFCPNLAAVFYTRLFIGAWLIPWKTYIGGVHNSGITGSNYADISSWNFTDCTHAYVNTTRSRITTTSASASLISDVIDRSLEPYETVAIAVRGEFDFYVDKSSVPVPITLEITDGGATIYGSKEYELPAAADTQNWIQLSVSGVVPASTDFYFRVKFYNSSGGVSGAIVSMSNETPDQGRIRLVNLSYGSTNYPYPLYEDFNNAPDYAVSYPEGHDYIVRWSDPSDLSSWRAAAFYAFLEGAGTLTAIHASETQLIFTKENSVWAFSYSDDPDIVIQLSAYHKGFGASTSQSIKSSRGRIYMVNENGLYGWTPGSQPEQLAHDGVREKVFVDNVPPSIMAIDEDNQRMYLASAYQTGAVASKLWAVDMTDWTWSEISQPNYYINDMIWGKFEGDDEAVLRLSCNPTGTFGSPPLNSYIYRLDGEAVKDSSQSTPNNTNIVSIYNFKVIQTPAPFKDMLVDFFELDHEITNDSTSDSFKLELSVDDGANWTNLGTFEISEVVSGADTTTLMFPVNRTVKRGMFRLTHTGRGGESAFNFNGARLLVQPLGTSIRPTGATSE
jgi:hypothetical protein